MFKIVKGYSKYQNYLNYLFISYPNIKGKPNFILSLSILAYTIQIYMLYIIFIFRFWEI